MWDVFPSGPRFGGAPANYASHAASLGANSRMISSVGRDELGARALKSLRELGVDTSAVQQGDFPTGAVHIELDAEGKASYDFLDNTAWDHLEWTAELEQLSAKTDAVCFGTLGQRSPQSQQTIRRFVSATPASCLRIFDVNLRPPYYSDDAIFESLKIANVLKLNDEELPILANLCELSGNDREVMQSLSQRFDLQLVALTRGAHGALLIRGFEVSDHAGVATQVVDTVGAGDAFTAAMTVGLLAGMDLDRVNERASQVATYVCSQAGATPRLPDSIVAR